MTPNNIKLEWIRPTESKSLALFKLSEPLSVLGHTIPSGFVTDGASVPVGFRSIFNPLGKAFPAAILHDYLLTNKSRKLADKIFLQALEQCGVGTGRRRLMYWAVRITSRIKGING